MDPSLEASLIQLAMVPLEPGPQQIVRIDQFDGLLSSRTRDKLQSLRELTVGLPLLTSQTAESFIARNDSTLGEQRELTLGEGFTILSEAVRKEFLMATIFGIAGSDSINSSPIPMGLLCLLELVSIPI